MKPEVLKHEDVIIATYVQMRTLQKYPHFVTGKKHLDNIVCISDLHHLHQYLRSRTPYAPATVHITGQIGEVRYDACSPRQEHDFNLPHIRYSKEPWDLEKTLEEYGITDVRHITMSYSGDPRPDEVLARRVVVIGTKAECRGMDDFIREHFGDPDTIPIDYCASTDMVHGHSSGFRSRLQPNTHIPPRAVLVLSGSIRQYDPNTGAGRTVDIPAEYLLKMFPKTSIYTRDSRNSRKLLDVTQLLK
jgi:hypothetical protein